MPHVEGLRSCYAKVGGLVYFGRAIDKRRLLRNGSLPQAYHANLGKGFDSRICKLLGISYDVFCELVDSCSSDEAIVEKCFSIGTKPTDEQCAIWNAFMIKRGWRDEVSEQLKGQIVIYGLSGKPIETFFDLIETDEGRDPSVCLKFP